MAGKKGILSVLEAISQAKREAEAAIAAEKAGKKMSKAELIESGYYHPIGTNKLKVPASKMSRQTIDDPRFQAQPTRYVSPEDLVGKVGIPYIGDRADTGKILTHINDIELPEGVELEGGRYFSKYNTYPDQPKKSSAWASDKAVINKLAKQTKKAAESGKEVLGINVLGSPTNVNFNNMVTKALFGQLDLSALRPDDIAEFNAIVRKAYPRFKGIDHPEVLDQLTAPGMGNMRKKVVETMDAAKFQGAGFPDVASTRAAVTEPALMDVPTGSAGLSIARINPENLIVEDPIFKHGTYPVNTGGEYGGEFELPMDFRDIFTDFTDARRLLGDKLPKDDLRSMSFQSPAIQEFDDEWLNRIMPTYEQIMKSKAYAKGGKVGKASKVLSEIEKAYQEAKAAKANYLKDSQVKDVMYHGSPYNTPEGDTLTEFNKGKGVGIHVGTQEQADNINKLNRGWNSEQYKGNAHILPLHINARNPLRVTDREANDPITLIRALHDKKLITDEQRERIRQEGNKNPGLGVWRDTARNILQDLGFDSLVYENMVEGAGDSYVLLNPNQLKSAIGNKGTFDPNETDIRKAKGGKVGRAGKIMEELNKAYEEAKAVEKVKAPAVTTTKRSGIKDLQNKVKEKRGTYGAQRVEQAADLVPNLEQQFTENALLKAFTGHGDNAYGLTVMSPSEFEDWAQPLNKSFASNKNYSPDRDSFMSHDEYIDYLARIARDSGFSEVPYLQMSKDEVGLPLKPYMVGHEGRHRTRALDKLGDKATLIEVMPRSDLREGLPRMSQEEYLDALKKELGMQSLVRPEPVYINLHDSAPRDAKVFPKIFKDGGKVDMEAEFKKADVIGMAEGGKSKAQVIKDTGKILARKAKESIKEESQTYKKPRVASDLANDYIANTLGAPVDLVNMGLSPFGLGSDDPFLGSEQIKRKMREYNLHSGTERPWAETTLDLLGPAALVKGPKAVKALAKEAARQIETGTGLGKYMVEPRMNVVKPEGGQWADSATAKIKNNFEDPQGNPDVNKWLKTTGRKYVLNRMGSPEDEVRKLLDKDISHIEPKKLSQMATDITQGDKDYIRGKRRVAGFPQEGLADTAAGKRWELMTDEYINPNPASVYQDPRFISEAPWAEKLDPDTPIYSGERGTKYLFNETGMPEIAAALNRAIKEKKLKPEQLNKVSMEDAVKLTHEQRVKDESELAKDLPKIAEYPEAGMSWQELTHEDPDVLRKVLRREGDIMQNCIGNYCEDVLEDGTKLYSLRDKAGNPHVNIEMKPVGVTYEDFKKAFGEEKADELLDRYSPKELIRLYPEFRRYSVKQIKGKQNEKPVKEYIPFVQDFLKNQGPFESIDDLSNAGMIDLRRAQKHGVLDDSYPTVMQELGRLFPAEKGEFGGINLTSDYGLRADTDVMLREALKGMEGSYVSPEDIITHMRAQEARPIEQGYSKYWEGRDEARSPIERQLRQDIANDRINQIVEGNAKGGQPKRIDLETQFRLADILTR